MAGRSHPITAGTSIDHDSKSCTCVRQTEAAGETVQGLESIGRGQRRRGPAETSDEEAAPQQMDAEQDDANAPRKHDD